ncbi:MAG: spermidine synthase, partial [Myxococcaceae bacterium]
DMDTQILLGQLGPLLHSGKAKTALVVGLGSGVTVGSLASHPELERIDVVEISPAVVEAARRFSYINGNALDDPRVHIHVDDARTFMLLQGLRYDVIVSEPSNPWVAGVAGLFTREFFRLAKDHLNHDGVFVQWMHLYEVETGLVQLVMRTVRDTFPYGTSWLGGWDLIMVSGAEPVTPDPSRLAERLAEPKVKVDLARMHVDGVAPLLSLQVHSSDGQLAFAGPGTINTEDKNDLEYRAPIAFFLRLPAVDVHDERRAADSSKLAITKYLGTHPLVADEAAAVYAAQLSAGSQDDPLVRAAAEHWFGVAPDDPRARRALGFAASAQRDVDTAKRMLGPFVSQPEASADSELVAYFLDAVAEEQKQRAAPWNPMPEFARQLAAEALIRAPNDVRLRGAAGRLCWGASLEKCLPEAVRTAKSSE